MGKPALNMIEIPDGKHPAWRKQENRFTFEEDMRIHLYDAIDNLNMSNITEEERRKWEKVITSLGELAHFFKDNGFPMHIH